MDLLLRFDDTGAAPHPLSARYAEIEPGVPGRCPACEAYGFIDALDFRRSHQTQHCRSCHYRWDYEFRDDGTILEVRGHGPLPNDGATDHHGPEPAPPPESPVERRRVVVRRRNRPLRADRRGDHP